jgi:hypothetical protein
MAVGLLAARGRDAIATLFGECLDLAISVVILYQLPTEISGC